MNRAKKSVVKGIPEYEIFLPVILTYSIYHIINYLLLIYSGSLDESLLQSICAGHDYNISNTPFVGKWATFRTFLLRVYNIS